MWSEIEKDQVKQWLRNWRAFNEMEEKLRRDQMCKDIRKGLSYSLTGESWSDLSRSKNVRIVRPIVDRILGAIEEQYR